VSYLAAWLGLVEYAQVAAGETVLVIGANGGVGGAAAQIGKYRGGRVIGADRRPLSAEAPAARAIDDFFVLGDQTLEANVRRATNGRGADLIFDTVGGPMFEPALKSLAHRGRLVEISSLGDRPLTLTGMDPGVLIGMDPPC